MADPTQVTYTPTTAPHLPNSSRQALASAELFDCALTRGCFLAFSAHARSPGCDNDLVTLRSHSFPIIINITRPCAARVPDAKRARTFAADACARYLFTGRLVPLRFAFEMGARVRACSPDDRLLSATYLFRLPTVNTQYCVNPLRRHVFAARGMLFPVALVQKQ